MSREFRPVLVRYRGRWRRGVLEGWIRGEGGAWTALTRLPTGAPVFSSTYEFLPASDVRDASACSDCPAHRTWLSSVP